MKAEDLVIERREFGWVVVAEPPEPVRGFGHQEGWWAWDAGLLDGTANLGQQSPGRGLFGVADPGGEDAVDPRAWVKPFEDGGSGGAGQGGEGLGLEIVAGLTEGRHEFAEKPAAAVRIVEPRVFAIEGEDDGRVLREGAAELDEIVDQRAGGARFIVPAAIGETDGIGQGAIAEEEHRTRP